MMKYLLILLLLACLAVVEYFHHRSHDHATDAKAHTAPQAKSEQARELLRQHLYGH
jgi:hypothetical protein